MKFLITGSSGFIGFHLAQKLLKKGHHVIGIDDHNDYYSVDLKKNRKQLLKHKNFKFYNIDINKLTQLRLSNEEIDVAINLAAQAGVRLPDNLSFKYEDSNIDGFRVFLEFCKNLSIKNILFASSSSVYGNQENVPFNENLKLDHPVSAYASSKIWNEIDAKNYQLQNDVNIIGIRFFTVYGPFGRPDMAYFNFTENIILNKEIKLFNYGELERDMTHINDVIEGLEKVIPYLLSTKNDFQIFNMGNEKPVKTIKVLKLIEKEVGKSALIKYINEAKEVKITHADSSKALKAFGFRPKVNIEHGISSFVRWYRDYFKI